MNKPILNREAKLPDDGWYEIETPGEHFNATSGLVQQLDGDAFAAIANRFQQVAAQPGFAGLLIDRDHFSLDTDKTSEAFGWLMEVRNRDGRLEGRVDWSDEGERAVKGRRFKFFSSVYDPEKCTKLGTRRIGNRDYPLVRPLELDRLALTNDPNNKGGKPISNRDGNPAGAAENQPVPTMKKVMKLLGLAEDASEDSAVAAVQLIQNRVSQAEGQVTTLTTERTTLLSSQVESDLEKYKNRFKPQNRETVKAQLVKNRAATIELLEATEAPAELTAEQKRITNRGAAKTPEQIAADANAEKAEQHAARISNRARSIRGANPKVSLSDAYATAEQEINAESAK